MVIVGCTYPKELGETFKGTGPLPSEDAVHNYRVDAASNKEEFIAFWLKTKPRELVRCLERYGEVDSPFFYKVTILDGPAN